ncbi:hypothetical protein ACXR0O_08375 [Verrucomicrobiota bacterium sgz303538]
MSNQAINPFGDLIVKDPRRREPAVSGLNERPLRMLLSQFERVNSGELPRELIPAEAAQLVTSEQPGYGKSHLIGRLFRELHGRATLVYVLPFQNAATAFQSLMLAITREMHFPDRANTGTWNREEPTQLDVLAHSVLAHVLADLVEDGGTLRIETTSETAGILRRNPVGAFQRGNDPWAKWLVEHWNELEQFFEEALARRGITIAAPGTWLRVLRAYAFAPFDAAVRRTCIDWITGQPCDVDDLNRIGLRASDAIGAEISPDEASDLCRYRVVELCQLASFFRPFVFCFDQTEVYGHHPALARAFGMVVATLVHEAPNHLTLITANQDPWTVRIAPHLERADLERIARPPVTLEGLNRAQASELARLRMEAVHADGSRAAAFLDSAWLIQLFPTERNQMGTRYFLQQCKERWDNEPSKLVALADLYHQRREKLLASPKRHLFEPDTLQWLVEEAAGGLDGIKVDTLHDKYFTVRWKTAERTCLFGFVPGSNWSQWRTIARAAVKKNENRTNGPVKAVFFRAPGQAPIPGAKWKSRDEIEAAKATCLHLVALSVEEISELHAARDLYADAVQGDIAYNAEQVLAFLREQLAQWWTRLRGPVATAEGEATPERVEIPGPLPKQVRAIVQREKFLSLEDVIKQLDGMTATKDEVLTACGFTPEIRVHSHPTMTVLQWQINV